MINAIVEGLTFWMVLIPGMLLLTKRGNKETFEDNKATNTVKHC